MWVLSLPDYVNGCTPRAAYVSQRNKVSAVHALVQGRPLFQMLWRCVGQAGHTAFMYAFERLDLKFVRHLFSLGTFDISEHLPVRAPAVSLMAWRW